MKWLETTEYTGPISLTVKFYVKENEVSKFREIMKTMVEYSNSDHGALMYKLNDDFKVRIFWEGHKILRNSPLTSTVHSYKQTKVSKRKISQNFVTFSEYMNFKDSTVFWLTEEWKTVSDLKNHATDENHGKVSKMLGETLRAPPHVGLYKNNS